MIHDADKRGDTSEIRSLNNAAPCRYSMTDTARFENALRHLCTFRYCDLLEIAAEFWHAKTRALWALHDWDEAIDIGQDTGIDPGPEREARIWLNIMKCTEYRYILERDGWNLFIQQSGFDVTRVDLMPKSWLIEYMDENVVIHPDTEDALRCLKKKDGPITLATPEDVAKDWHEVVSKLANNELI